MKTAGKILGYILLIALVLVIGYGALRALPRLLPDSSSDSAGSDTGSADSFAGGSSSGNSSSGSGSSEGVTIDEETFEILGAASIFTDLTNLRLRFGAAVSAAAYEGMQDDPELEIGLITIPAESCPERLTADTPGARVEVFDLSELTPDEAGKYQFTSGILQVSSKTSEIVCAGYIRTEAGIGYTARKTGSVEYVAEHAYSDPGYTGDRKAVVPFLSKAYREANDISDTVTLTVTIGGDLQSAVGSSQMECFTEERLFIDEILEYGGESARVLEYDVDGGYYILVVPTGGAFYESEGAIEVTSDRGGLLE